MSRHGKLCEHELCDMRGILVRGRSSRFTAVVVTLAFGVLLAGASRLPANSAGLAQAQSTQKDVYDTPGPPPAPVQPVPYSHKAHVALHLKCEGCHANPDPGALMAYPATSACMKCHANTAKSKPGVQKLAEYSKSNTPIPWVRVYASLPGTGYSHRKHLDKGMKCEMCHGDVAQMDAMSEVKSTTSMGGCIGCHKLHAAATTCVTCHPAWGIGMAVRKD